MILPDRVKIWNDALPRAYMVGRMKSGEKSKIIEAYYDESFDPLSEDEQETQGLDLVLHDERGYDL